MGKKKVLFISAANSIHTVKWVNSLAEEFEIHLAYCCNHKPSIDNINNKVILHELKFKAPFGYYFNAIQLKKIEKNIKPDIINVHYASGYGTLARIAKLKNVLLSVWGSDVYDFPNESKFNRYILRKNVMHASALASTSNVMAEELKKQNQLFEKKIYITPFGVDIEKFKNDNCIKSNDEFNIGVVKTLKKLYGIEYAIKAVDLLKKELLNINPQLSEKIKFYIYGDGECKEELHDLICKLNQENSIFLKGKIPNEEVPNVLKNFDVFCVTSLKESFGVAVVEAMSMNLPVVATNVDGFREVMIDGKTGYIVETKNENAVKDALMKLVLDYEKRNEFGKNGRKRVEELYDWNKNVEEMKKIYNEMMEGE